MMTQYCHWHTVHVNCSLQCAVVHKTHGSCEGFENHLGGVAASLYEVGHFDKGSCQLRKGSRAAVAAPVKLAAVAREAGKENLACVFQWEFYEQILRATEGHRISLLQEDENAGKNSGLMLLTFGHGQFYYASAFLTALKQTREAEDAGVRTKAQKTLDALVKSAFPKMKPSGKKTEQIWLLRSG
jgi:hypothetical protein